MSYDGEPRRTIADQAQLWNLQHAQRASVGMESRALRDVPSDSAVAFAQRLIHQPSNILEIGCAHGRDARYWATLGHHVVCTDFSSVALDQLHRLAQEQGVRDSLCPVLHDISTGKLPDIGNLPLHGFYGRSALHIDDETMMSVAREVDAKLVSGGVILVEGKGDLDHKIKRSVQVGNGLVVDPYEKGHLRRAWTCDFMSDMCDKFNWRIISLEQRQEVYEGNTIDFLRLIACRT